MRRLVAILLLLPLAAGAQPRFGAAVKVGIPFQGWFENVGGREFAYDASRHWALGPALEVTLIGPVSIEASGLYRRVGRDAGGGYLPFSDRERGYSWEFPLAFKIRLPSRIAGLRPFAEAGPAVSWSQTHIDSNYTTAVNIPNLGVTFVGASAHSATSDLVAGVTFGGGVERRVEGLRFSVEARYTRWNPGECWGQDLRCIAPNQGAVQLGFGF